MSHNAHKIESNWKSQPTDDDDEFEDYPITLYKSVSMKPYRTVATQIHMLQECSNIEFERKSRINTNTCYMMMSL